MTVLADVAVSNSGDGFSSEIRVFTAVWIVLGIASYLFFHFNRNAWLKRRIWSVFIIAIGLTFGGFIYFIMGRQQPQILYFMVPAVFLISFINIRRTKFCNLCGKTINGKSIFTRTQICPHCGADLK